MRTLGTVVVMALAAVAYAADNPADAGGKFKLVGDQQTHLKTFFNAVHQANQNEIEAGRLALRKTQCQAVRNLARRMVDDHTAADAKVRDLAEKKGIRLTGSKTEFHSLPELAAEQMEQRTGAKLHELSGRDFDLYYVALQFADHEWVTSFLTAASQHLQDQDAARLASELNQTIQEHLALVKRTGEELCGAAQGK